MPLPTVHPSATIIQSISSCKSVNSVGNPTSTSQHPRPPSKSKKPTKVRPPAYSRRIVKGAPIPTTAGTANGEEEHEVILDRDGNRITRPSKSSVSETTSSTSLLLKEPKQQNTYNKFLRTQPSATHGRSIGFTHSFNGVMFQDTTLTASTHYQHLKFTEEERKKAQADRKILEMEDAHVRMLHEICLLKQKEEKIEARRQRRLKRKQARMTALQQEQDYKEQVVAATRIQTQFRGLTTRKNMHGKLQQKKQERQEEARGTTFITDMQSPQQDMGYGDIDFQNEEDRMAVLKLQSCYRGYKSRSELEIRKSKSRNMRRDLEEKYLNATNNLDKKLYKYQLQEYDKAARKRQRLSHREQYKIQEIKEQTRAATKLQSQFRGQLVRKTFSQQSRTVLSEEEEAAVKLQAQFRGLTGRRAYQKEKEEANNAATKLQSRFRGMTDRRAYRREKDEVDKAATKLQSQFRGRAGRKAYLQEQQELTRAATKLQSSYRGFQARSEKKQQAQAAIKIQYSYRKRKDQQSVNVKSSPNSPSKSARRTSKRATQLSKPKQRRASLQRRNSARKSVSQTTPSRTPRLSGRRTTSKAARKAEPAVSESSKHSRNEEQLARENDNLFAAINHALKQDEHDMEDSYSFSDFEDFEE